MRKVNMTPHTINLNDGTSLPSEGVARVAATFSKFNSAGICSQRFGEIEGLPEPRPAQGDSQSGEYDVYYIVSALVLSAAKAQGRRDCVAPATGHPDTVRNEKGHIVSVPGYVR